MSFQRQRQEKQPQGTKRALRIVHTQTGIIETYKKSPLSQFIEYDSLLKTESLDNAILAF